MGSTVGLILIIDQERKVFSMGIRMLVSGRRPRHVPTVSDGAEAW